MRSLGISVTDPNGASDCIMESQ